MCLKIAQLDWPIDANEAYGRGGTGQGAIGNC